MDKKKKKKKHMISILVANTNNQSFSSRIKESTPIIVQHVGHTMHSYYLKQSGLKRVQIYHCLMPWDNMSCPYLGGKFQCKIFVHQNLEWGRFCYLPNLSYLGGQFRYSKGNCFLIFMSCNNT